MANTTQLLKAYGHLPTIGTANLSKAYIDTPQYAAVLDKRFCGCPDYGDEEIADSRTEDLVHSLDMDRDYCEHLINMHRRILESSGAGSWPEGCHTEYPKIHAVAYYVNWDSFPKQYTRTVKESELDALTVWGSREEVFDNYNGKQMLEVAFSLVERAYARVNVKLFRTDHTKDQIHVLSKYIAGSTIGFAYYPDGTCGDHVTCNIDNSYSPHLSACAMLLAHEIGHNNKLPHVFNGQSRHRSIMSYQPKYPFVGFSLGKAPYDRPLDASMAQLIRQYGEGNLEKPIDPVPIAWPSVKGQLYVERLPSGKFAIRGEQMIGKWPYIVTPVDDKFVLVPKIL